MQNFQEEDKPSKVSFSIWKKLFSILKSLKKEIIILIILATTIAILDALINVLNVYAIENFIEGRNYHLLPAFIVINVIYAIFFGLNVWLFIKKGSIIEARVNYSIRKEAFANLQKLSFDYFDVTPQGWIMARMTSDSKRLSNIISWTLLDLVWSVLFMIFTMVVLFIYSTKLALIVLAAIPIMFLIAILFRKRILKSHRLSRKYNSMATAKYSEAFLGAKTTKTLVIEEDNLNEFNEVTNDLRKATIKAISISSLFSSILLIVTYIIVGIVMYQGSDLIIKGIIELPILFLFIRATISFFDPVMMLTQIMSSMQQAQASAERIIGLIETKPSIEDSAEVIEKYGDILNPKKENFKDIKGDVEFRNIKFEYKKDETILNNFNLKIKAGSKVALVGHTGSGKTTLVNLLARFYEPTDGEILIDNINYKDMSQSYLHSQIGYVLQTPHLFSTTIYENIRYGKLEATKEEIINAAKMVGVHDFIMTLEKGYDTHVGEGGNLLSMGQKQLISFARALIRNPKILLLDEATSSIDSKSEEIITKATKTILNNRTSLVVAHRLSTIVDSDLIVMLRMGEIIEMGTHEELLNLRGEYFELYKNQFFQEHENMIIDNI